MGMISSITGVAAKTWAKVSLAAVKKAPDLLFAGGVISGVSAIVLAVAVTNKASEVMDNFDKEIERIDHDIEVAESKENPESYYPQINRVKDRRSAYKKMIKSMAKLYIPSATLEIVSIVCFGKSVKILSKRNAGLAAACGMYAAALNDYRGRVRDYVGPEIEENIWNGVQSKTEIVQDISENGIVTEKEETKETYNPLSPFSFQVSLEENPWNLRDPYSILDRIDITQRTLNNKLQKKRSLRGVPFITMNEIAEAFGQEQRPEWSTFVIYQNLKDIEGPINVGISIDNICDQKTVEWKFINKIIDGIWITPNIQGNLCDDLDLQYTIMGINQKRGEQNAKRIFSE